MPPRKKTQTSTAAKNQDITAQRARKLLAGASRHNESSEEGLDDEDEPWKWIYEGKDEEEDDENDVEEVNGANTPSRGSRFREKKIVGAQRGTFVCRTGDCVVLNPDRNEIWAGIVAGFREDNPRGFKEDSEELNMEVKIMCMMLLSPVN